VVGYAWRQPGWGSSAQVVQTSAGGSGEGCVGFAASDSCAPASRMSPILVP